MQFYRSFHAIVFICGIAALGFSSPGLAVNFLGAEFSQGIHGMVRDYESHSSNDPGYNVFEARMTVESDYFPAWPVDSNLLAAKVERPTGSGGISGTVVSASLAAFQFDPFTLTSGFASIGQWVDADGAYQAGPPFYRCEAAGGAGNDHIYLRFRVDESDGNVVLRVRSAWANDTPVPHFSYGSGHPGYITMEKNGIAIAGSSGAQSDLTDFTLTPGDWSLHIEKQAVNISNLNVGSLAVSGHMSVSWTFDSTFLSETPDKPIVVSWAEPGETATDCCSTASAKLALPIQGAIGHTGAAFIGVSTRVNGGRSQGALITGYEVKCEDCLLSSLIVPELPPGAGGLTIDLGAGPQSVTVNQALDFGAGGIQSFILAGFDPMQANAEADAFVMGLQFAQEGLASLCLTPTLFIPNGDFNKNGLVDAPDYITWRKGLAAGTYMQDDYDLWRTNFGEPVAGGSANNASSMGSAIPEPTATSIICVALFLITGLRSTTPAPSPRLLLP